MQEVVFAARVLAVLLALLLLPGQFSQQGTVSSELCAAEASAGCVVEIASYCDWGDDWLVDRYRKDD